MQLINQSINQSNDKNNIFHKLRFDLFLLELCNKINFEWSLYFDLLNIAGHHWPLCLGTTHIYWILFWINLESNTLQNSSCTITYLLLHTFGGAHGVMVTVLGNGHGDTSSNPGRD